MIGKHCILWIALFLILSVTANALECNKIYSVRHGDTLSLIAGKAYNNINAWEVLHARNRSTIGKNPNKILAGQRLYIPCIDDHVFKDKEISVIEPVKKKEVKSVELLTGNSFDPFIGESLPHGGMATHIVREAYNAININPEIWWIDDFGSHFELVEKGKMDMAFPWFRPRPIIDCKNKNLSEKTKKRCEFIFSDTMYEVVLVFYKRTEDKRTVSSFEDIARQKMKICRPDGYMVFDLEKEGLGNNIVRARTPKDCFDKLVKKEVDLTSFNHFTGQTLIKEMKIGELVESVENPSTILELCMIAHQDTFNARVMIKQFNDGLKKLKENEKKYDGILSDHTINWRKRLNNQ